MLYRKWQTKPSQRKRKARRQSGYLRRLYEQLKNEENQKARQTGKKVHPAKHRVPKNSTETQEGLLQ